MIRCILTDIEGTTTPISFVHDVLFPYAAAHLAAFVEARADEPSVRACLEQVRQTIEAEDQLTPDHDQALIAKLLEWIKADRKHPALKTLQGMIWKLGYASGAFQSLVYPDVPPALDAWKKAGLQLAVYSSGSVEAQKLLFRHSDQGDLTPFFSAWFDTRVGAKREQESYSGIAEELGLSPPTILFLSDIAEELDAAKAAGCRTIQIVRPGTTATRQHPVAMSFADVL